MVFHDLCLSICFSFSTFLTLSISLFCLAFSFSSGSCRGPENLATGEKFMRRQIRFACTKLESPSELRTALSRLEPDLRRLLQAPMDGPGTPTSDARADCLCRPE